MRLDIFIKNRENISRTKATRYIENGQIFVNEKVIQKPAYFLQPNDKVELRQAEVNFVSQGGYKLFRGLQHFNQSVQNKIFADIGASTGGFTDCLLQFGAKKVYAIDVGKNQLDSSLVTDERVVILDGCNAKTLTANTFAECLDGVVVDVSFISLKYIFSVVNGILQTGKELYALIKPQFETEGKWLDKHGIVKDKKVRHLVISTLVEIAKEQNLYLHNITPAPIVAQKNIEYIAYFKKGVISKLNLQNIFNELK